jgi:hypothetical protein
MKNTVNLQINNGKYTDEYLGKLGKSAAASAKLKEEQKRIERDNANKELTTESLSGEERSRREAEIDKRLDEQYQVKTIAPEILTGRNGQIAAKHKNKLAFIFIGDTKKSESQTKLDINSPKISMIVGGGLETPNTQLNPTEDYVIGVAAQLHLVSLADIDVKGILPVSTLKNRSAIKGEADVVDLAGSELVLIRSLGRPYKAAGARTLAPGGVHIIAGQEGRKPEPMVLGKALADTLNELATRVSEINSVVMSMNEDILALKVALLAHIHPHPLGPTLPSIDLVAAIAPSLATKTALNIASGYSNLLNMEVLKLNSLTGFSPNKFLSEYNRVN